MKKKSIILSVATCCFAAFTACDMDLASETSIPTNQSVQSVQDCGKYSNLFHAEWRGYVQNSYTMDALVQSGLITATADYGRMVLFTAGTIPLQTELFPVAGAIIIIL